MTFYKFLAAAKLELLENPAAREHVQALIEREIIAESERQEIIRVDGARGICRINLTTGEVTQIPAVKSALKIQGMH